MAEQFKSDSSSFDYVHCLKSIVMFGTCAFPKKLLLVLLMFPAVVTAYFDSNEDIGILGGLIREEFLNSINYLALSKWLLIISVPVLIHSVLLGILKKNIFFIIPRVRNHKILWGGILINGIVVSFLYSLFLFLIKFYCVHASSDTLIKAFLLFVLHLVFLLSFDAALFVYMPERSNYSPVICLLLETVSFSIYQSGLPCWYLLPGIWGMYYQSSFFSGGGFPVSVFFVLESLIIAVLNVFIPGKKNLCE